MIKPAVATVVLLAAPCLAAEPVHLGYKFDADAPTHFELVQEMTQSQTVQGQKIDTSTTTSSEMMTELLGVNQDGSILIGTTTQSLKLSMSSPGVNLNYDSTLAADKSKLSDPTIASMAGMVGLQVQLLISPDGTILDVPNIDAIQKGVDAMPDPAVQSGAATMTDKATVMAANEMNFKLLPDSPVEIGDRWHREFVVPFGFGDMTTTFDLTLDAVRDGIASISITGSMSMPQIVEQGVTMNMSNADVSGTLKFNIEDGVQELYDMSTVMDMTATMEGMPGPVFNMSMNQRVKMTRVDD